MDAGFESEVGQISTGKRSPQVGVAGMFLLLICGLGSIAIGVSGVGFSGDHEFLRWLPVVVGAPILLIGLISIPIELGALKSGDPDPDA